MHAHIRITRLYAMILYMSVNASAYRALPRKNELFQFFNGSFLKASKAVLFDATAIHCHHGMDLVDASFFVLGAELLVCPNSKLQSATEDRKAHERVELLQRKY